MSIAGFGLRQAATVDSLKSALSKVDAGGVTAIATPADKADFVAIQSLAKALGVRVIAVSEADLTVQRTATNSARVQQMRGTGSVAEASALAAAGSDARLTGPRVVSDDRMATCAIALESRR